MKRLLMIAALTISACAISPAHGMDMVVREGSTVIRLEAKPCATPAAVADRPEGLDHFRNMVLIRDGHTYRGCWCAHAPWALFFYEDGDTGELPMSVFKPEPGV